MSGGREEKGLARATTPLKHARGRLWCPPDALRRGFWGGAAAGQVTGFYGLHNRFLEAA